MAGEVRLRVIELYSHPEPAVKQAADAALQEFQKTNQAWIVGRELLTDADASVQFFGAQTLHAKAQQVLKGYITAEGEDLCALAANLQQCLGATTLSQASKQSLVLALAALVVHLCTTLWKGAVADLLALASSQPQHAWCTLLAVPEQLSGVAHTYVKTDRRTTELLCAGESLVNAALRQSPQLADEAVTGTLADSSWSLAMQALTKWSKVLGLQLATHEGFATGLVELLQSPSANSEVLMDLLVEVLRSSPGAFALYHPDRIPTPTLERVLNAVVKNMQALLPTLQDMAQRPPMSLDEGDAKRLSRWAEVASTLVEVYTQLLWVEPQAADVLVTFLGACFVVHPHIARGQFELWSVLKDIGRDGRLPDGVLPGLLRRLAPACVESLARFGRLDAPYAEDPSELEQIRDAQSDVLVDMFCVAASTAEEAPRILALLSEHLHRAETAKDWRGLEVMWFAFNGIAEVLAGEPALPEPYPRVLQSVFSAEVVSDEQASTGAALLRACGPHYENGLRPQLAPAVQWLVAAVPRVPAAASEAVQELCGYAGQHLLAHVEEFLKVVAASAPAAPAEVDAALHGALAGIIRALPRDQAVAAFAQICAGAGVVLAGGIDVGHETGRRNLHRCCCRLLRCTLVLEQGGTDAEGSPSGGTPSAAAQTASTCLASFLISHWGALAPPCQRLLCAAAVPKDAPKGRPIFEYSDEAAQVNILALLRYAAKAANEAVAGGPELAAYLLHFAISCCGEGQLACLSALAILANNSEAAKSQVLPALGGICSAASNRVQSGHPPEELIPLLDLASSLSCSVGDELFQSPQLPVLAHLCVSAARSTDQDILKPALLFLQKLAMSRSPSITEQCVREVMEATLLHFHLWPRTLGGQVFKLFSAFAERHEQTFLALAASPAVPSIAILPTTAQELARKAMCTLKGPRLRAFLADLGMIARGENTVDALEVYAPE